jgi:hypothetical protein
MHGERKAAGARGAQFKFVGVNQDELAEVRSYQDIPIEGALRSLSSALMPYTEAFREAENSNIVLHHPARGDQFAIDVLRSNVHDAHHHALDLERIRAGE